MYRHGNIRLSGNSILRSPQTGDSLKLGIEVHSWLAIEVACTTASDGLLVAGEGEHWERD